MTKETFYFIVSYEDNLKTGGNVVFSTNIIEVNAVDEVYAAIAATKHAAKHAARYHYADYGLTPALYHQIAECLRKGMPKETLG